jgi:hypothetical protein
MLSPSRNIRKRIPQPQADLYKPGPVSRKWWLPNPPELEPFNPCYLCHVCCHIDFDYVIFKCGFVQVLVEMLLDRLSLVLQRQHCAFCRLVKQTLEHFFGAEAVSRFSQDDTLITSTITTFRYHFTSNSEPW